MADVKNGKYYFYILPNLNGKRTNITIARVLYYCFVEEFDLNDKTLVVVNQSDPFWNMDISKLSLRSVYSMLKEKKQEENQSTI